MLPLAPRRTVAPQKPVLTLEEAKAQCLVDDTVDDEQVRLLERLVRAATADIDAYAGTFGQALITQTWQQEFSGFGCELRLPVGPVQSVSFVKYYDAANVQQTLNSSVYVLRRDALGPFVELAVGQSWPSTYGRRDGVLVEWKAGYGDEAKHVPEDIRHAVVLMVKHWYENREAGYGGNLVTELPMGVAALLGKHRRIGF